MRRQSTILFFRKGIFEKKLRAKEKNHSPPVQNYSKIINVDYYTNVYSEEYCRDVHLELHIKLKM